MKRGWTEFQWLRGLRHVSAVASVLEFRVRILRGAWMSVSFDCSVLSGRGLCVELITRPEESRRLWCVCDFETATIGTSRPTRALEPR